MRISFLKDLNAQVINSSIYTSTQNPVVIPIGSADTAYSGRIKTKISADSLINVLQDTTETTAANFDYNFLFPKKLQQKTLLGGLYFTAKTTVGPNSIYAFNTITNTRSPTSYLYLQTLAA
jgi:hypothetical protein